MRVRDRQQALGDFDALTPDDMSRLAREYGVSHLVTPHRLGRPALHRDGRFWIYALDGTR